jgi:hypothetical protein
LPTRAWQPLAAILIVFGIPGAVVATWRHLVARQPVAALVLGVGWLAICGACVLVRLALAGPARRRLEQAGNAADRTAACWLSGYGRRYRRWVLDSRRYIDVKDLATGGDHTPELDDVYVDVALVRRAAHQVSGNPLSVITEDAEGRHSISEFLDRRDQVVLAVIGPAGSGKSTLLAHAARRSARAGRQCKRRVPVLLALREHAGAISGCAEASLPEVLRPAVRGVPGSEPDGWWERQLGRGRCLILFDGLDEVACEESRRAVTAWVERQISSYPGNHFVITSRPHGFRGPVIAQADVLAVRPFTAVQVQVFLDRWYLAAERHATAATSKAQMRAVRIRAGESAARLFALLRADPALHDLTVNPLLLTMIAMVHRYRGALLGSRADLYGEICQVVPSRRVQAKDLPELLPWSAKRMLLTVLAYEMMISRVSELGVSAVLSILDPLLCRLPQPVTGQAFLDDACRNGLQVEAAPARYAFTHVTFQEYLSARHAAATPGAVATLVGAVDDLWWREAIVLYAAIADAGPVVRACLDSGTISALTLAFECAENSIDLALELRQRLDRARSQAFEQDCDPCLRRLVAAVLAASRARRTVTASTGARICDRPLSAGLYWLFLQDSRSSPPDNPCDADLDRPATGVWAAEALAFLAWLNEISAGSAQAGFRFPYEEELREQAVTSVLTQQLPDAVTSVWVQPPRGSTAPGLWVPPGSPHPLAVTGDAMRQAVVLDTTNTEILIRILLVAALSTAHNLAHDLGRDLARGLDLVRVLPRARSLDLVHNLDLVRDLATGLAPTCTLDFAGGLELARDLALVLACATNLPRALDLASALTGTLASALKLDGDLRIRLPGIGQIPLAWVRDGPLGRAARKVTAIGTPSRRARQTFANEFTSNAGIERTRQIRASLDASPIKALRDMSSADPRSDQASPAAWDTATGAHILAEISTPLLSEHQRPGAPEAAGIRFLALALACDSVSTSDGVGDTFRSIAATITLIQHRERGNAKIGESIILALT